jgi:hypothetical protein
VTLQLAQISQEVTVTENSAEVHTADTQIGQTIESKQIVDIPLNGRGYTNLLAVQAVVAPITTSGAGNTSSGGGFGTIPAAGNTNTGQFSIHGQRESDNAYFLNGASVQETIGQQAGIIPNLDSIAEFRILSSNVDAEYGSFTGGLINVVTKSGPVSFMVPFLSSCAIRILTQRITLIRIVRSFTRISTAAPLVGRSAKTRSSFSPIIRDSEPFRVSPPAKCRCRRWRTGKATSLHRASPAW